MVRRDAARPAIAPGAGHAVLARHHRRVALEPIVGIVLGAPVIGRRRGGRPRGHRGGGGGGGRRRRRRRRGDRGGGRRVRRRGRGGGGGRGSRRRRRLLGEGQAHEAVEVGAVGVLVGAHPQDDAIARGLHLGAGDAGLGQAQAGVGPGDLLDGHGGDDVGHDVQHRSQERARGGDHLGALRLRPDALVHGGGPGGHLGLLLGRRLARAAPDKGQVDGGHLVGGGGIFMVGEGGVARHVGEVGVQLLLAKAHQGGLALAGRQVELAEVVDPQAGALGGAVAPPGERGERRLGRRRSGGRGLRRGDGGRGRGVRGLRVGQAPEEERAAGDHHERETQDEPQGLLHRILQHLKRVGQTRP